MNDIIDLFKRKLDRFIEYRFFILAIVKKEFKGRYIQSYLSIAWIVLEPLILVLTLSTIFVIVKMRISDDGTPFPILFYSALLPFSFFKNCMTTGPMIFIQDSALLKKIYYPRSISVISKLFIYFIDYLFANIAFVIVLIVYRYTPNWNYFYIPLLLILLSILMLGLMFLLSSLNVYIRDVGTLSILFSSIHFWFTPIIFVFPYQGLTKWAYFLNPVCGVVSGFRNIIIYNQPPILEHLLPIIISGPLTLIMGYAVFAKLQRNFIDVI